MSEIAIIAPHRNLLKIAEAVVAQGSDPIQLFEGDLERGLQHAKNAIALGAKVLISRGGTYLLLREQLPNIPVVEIQVTGYDLIRALKKAGPVQKVALCGYPNIFWGAGDISDLFGLGLTSIVVQQGQGTDSIKDRLIALRGVVDLVVGDTVGVRLAQQVGLATCLIDSGEEAVHAALQEATRVLEVKYTEARRAEELHTILNFIDNGIVSVNQDGFITLINPAAQEKLGINAHDALGKPIRHVIPSTKLPEVLQTGTSQIGDVQMVAGKQLVSNRVPIMVNNKIAGAVATFQEVDRLQTLEQKVRITLHQKGLFARYTFEDIIGDSPAILQTKTEAQTYARTDSTILITAETGSGKEVFAQSIHNASQRKTGPFVAINCGALPATLLESELFGYAEGSFTGAKKEGKPGIFELAHGGTLFLDEIGEIPANVQVQLLRVLQERTVRRIGDDKVIPVNVRIIAATNKDLFSLMEQGHFRSDLYYRLDVLHLKLPPLRSRREDILPLFRHFGVKHGWQQPDLTPEAIAALEAHTWPGNIRELENTVEKLWLLSGAGKICSDLLKRALRPTPRHEAATLTLAELERQRILETLKVCNGDREQTASRLGISRTTLWRKLKEFHIET